MKILMVAIPNHHFFQWVSQLEGAGFEVYWFDISGSAHPVERINWVKQIRRWKIRVQYPFRTRIKNNFPGLYHFIQKFNETPVSTAFEKTVRQLKPDMVHCFEMKLAGLPILATMEKHPGIKFVYSSWGSDLFYFREMKVPKSQVAQFLKRVDFLLTDCQRDYKIALENGFANQFLGVFPGNGGIRMETDLPTQFDNRNTIIIKGYEDGVGKAIKVLDALKEVPGAHLNGLKIVIFSADTTVQDTIKKDVFFKDKDVTVFARNQFLPNASLLAMMQQSLVYVGNSISDGMPNTLLEAMAMGAFPIQSNPGNVTAEVIEHGKNGFLINNPLKSNEIATLILQAISNEQLRKEAFLYNIAFMEKNYNRKPLKNKIVHLYQHKIA